MRPLARPSLAPLAIVLAAAALTGCGGDDDDAGAQTDLVREQLAEERIARERADAARAARQEERLKQLEEELREAKRPPSRGSSRPPASEPASTAPGTPPPSNGGDWPGGSGHTAILASKSSEADARAMQREASARGLDAGVLHSSDFRSLRPGYWVVFSGRFGSSGDASRRAARAKELGYGDAYPRFVSP